MAVKPQRLFGGGSTSRAVSWTAATTERDGDSSGVNLAIWSSTSILSIVAGDTGDLDWAYTMNEEEVGLATWPTSLLRAEVNVSSTGANITWGFKTFDSSHGGFCRVTTDEATLRVRIQGSTTFSGTGYKREDVASPSWNVASPLASDKFGVAFAGANNGGTTQTVNTIPRFNTYSLGLTQDAGTNSKAFIATIRGLEPTGSYSSPYIGPGLLADSAAWTITKDSQGVARAVTAGPVALLHHSVNVEDVDLEIVTMLNHEGSQITGSEVLNWNPCGSAAGQKMPISAHTFAVKVPAVSDTVYPTYKGSGAASMRATLMGFDLPMNSAWVYRNSDQGSIQSTYVDLAFNTAGRVDSATFTFDSGTGEVLVKTAGTYLILYRVSVLKTSGTAQTGFEARLAVKPSGSSYAELAGSFRCASDGYQGGSLPGNLTGCIAYTFAANDTVKLQVKTYGGSDTLTAEASRNGLLLIQLPTGASVFSGYEATTNSSSTATWVGVEMDTEIVKVDFTHSTSTNPARVTIPATGTYFLWNSYAGYSSGTRGVACRIAHSTDASAWQTLVAGGGGRWSADANQRPSAAAMTIADLASGEYVQTEGWLNTTTTLYAANQFTILRLDNLATLAETGKRYWVGTTGNWNDATNWAYSSGGAGGRGVPTATQDVYFDANSGTGTVTVNATAVCKSLDFTGCGALTLAGSSGLTVSGNLIMVSGLATPSYTGTMTFDSSSAQTITSGGKTCSFNLTFNGTGSWALQDDFTTGASATVTLTKGTLDLSTRTLTCGYFLSNNANTRNLTCGTGSAIVLAFTSAGTLWDTTDCTGLTVTNPTNCTVSLTGNVTTGTRTVVSDSSPVVTLPHFAVTSGTASNVTFTNVTCGNVSLSATSGTTTLSGCSVANLTFQTGYTGTWANDAITIRGNLTLISGQATPTAGTGTVTFTGTSSHTITSAGKTIDRPVTFNGTGTWTLQDALSLSARAVTLTQGTLAVNGQTLTAGSFASSNSNTRSITFGTAGAVILSDTGTAWDCATSTNLTITMGASAYIKLTSSTTPLFKGGGKTYQQLWFSAGSGTFKIEGSNTFNTLKVT